MQVANYMLASHTRGDIAATDEYQCKVNDGATTTYVHCAVLTEP